MRFLSGVSLAAAALLASTLRSAETPFAWRSVNIQGMGYVTGLVVHPKPPHDIYLPEGRRWSLPIRPWRAPLGCNLWKAGFTATSSGWATTVNLD